MVFPDTHFPWLLLPLLGLQLLIMWLLASISWLLVPGDTASSLCPFALWVAVVSLISSGMPLCPLSYHLCNQSSSLRSLYCKYLMWLLFPQLESLIHITFVGRPLRARLCAECTGQEALCLRSKVKSLRMCQSLPSLGLLPSSRGKPKTMCRTLGMSPSLPTARVSLGVLLDGAEMPVGFHFLPGKCF